MGCRINSQLISFLLHFGAIALLMALGAARPVREKLTAAVSIVAAPLVEPILMTPRDTGGGGGGDRSPIPASHGRLPKLAPRQFTPPMAVVHSPNPRLTVEPSLIIEPDVQVPNVNVAELGDPLGQLGPRSNGPGSGGGIGEGAGGGVGRGRGPGAGDGEGGGYGGGLHAPKAVRGAFIGPALLYKVEPDYSDEGRKARCQGTIILAGDVDVSGRLCNIRIVRGLGLGLDEKAVEAVLRWKFRPGYRDGKPVVAPAWIEVTFRLL